jgi:hypothetical protein
LLLEHVNESVEFVYVFLIHCQLFGKGVLRKKNRKDSFSCYDVDVVECGF